MTSDLSQDEKQWDGIAERRQNVSLEAEIVRLRTILQILHRDVSSLATRIDTMKPPIMQVLSVAIAMTVLVLGIVASVGKLAVVDPMERIESRIGHNDAMLDKLDERIRGHFDGHPERIEKMLRDNKDRIQKIEDYINRQRTDARPVIGATQNHRR